MNNTNEFYIISLYKTAFVLMIIVLITRLPYAKSLIQKETFNKKDSFIISTVFSILGIITCHLPYNVYGSFLIPLKILIISQGIIFGKKITIPSVFIVTVSYFLINKQELTVFDELFGLILSGFLSSYFHDHFIKSTLRTFYYPLIGVAVGIISQFLSIYIPTLYHLLVLKNSFSMERVFNTFLTMSLMQVFIFVFIMVIEDITIERQSYNKKNIQNEYSNAKLLKLQAQINPHFLFNTLNVIGLLCIDQPKTAREIIVKLSTYIRRNLELDDNLITIQDELEQVKCYLDIQQTRFQEYFDVIYDIDFTIQKKIPSLTIQPIVENALLHGVLPCGEKKKIYISIQREQDKVKIMVKNDGIPINQKIINDLEQGIAQHGRIGLNNVNERLILLYGEGIKINALENGTEMIFYVK